MEFQQLGQLNKDNKVISAPWLSSVLDVYNDEANKWSIYLVTPSDNKDLTADTHKNLVIGNNIKQLQNYNDNILIGNNISCVNTTNNIIVGKNINSLNSLYNTIVGDDVQLISKTRYQSGCTVIGQRYNIQNFQVYKIIALSDNTFVTPYHPHEFIFGSYEGSNEISTLQDYLDTKTNTDDVNSLILEQLNNMLSSETFKNKVLEIIQNQTQPT